MRRKAGVLPACLLVGVLLVACGPGGSKLPQGAIDALANAVAEHEGAHFKYSIVSAQEATATAFDPEAEAEELWCVVIDQEVTMPWLWIEFTTNRFLAVKEKGVWSVAPAEALWGPELNDNPPGPGEVGCDNFVENGE